MSDGLDARRVAGEAQAELRVRGVRMLQRGATHTQVADTLGVALRTVAGWSARFRVSGWDGLGARRRGRRRGEQMALSESQQAELICVMTGSNEPGRV